MLKPTVKRGLMLDFIPDEINFDVKVNPNRIFKLNNNNIKSGDIIYLMSREYRLEDNWAALFAKDLAAEFNKKLKIVILLDKNLYSKCQESFLLEGIEFLKYNLENNKIDFEITDKMPTNAGVIIVDFNPINLMYDYANKSHFAVFEVDSHNIIPARYISDKQEYSAATLRRKTYGKIAEFLKEYPNNFDLKITESNKVLKDFIQNKLDSYAEQKNNPLNDVTSNLSPYLHFGFISSQRIAIEVIKSSASRENKETFLEELIVRKELSDNFCLYSPDFKSFQGISPWAKETLDAHKWDIRTYKYTLQEFDQAKTHDKLWNKIQNHLLSKNRIHGYLRMYWAKKILEWAYTPEDALKIAILLNDKYALDGCDPNGYVGILWSIGGLHDRAFTNKPVTGKIRNMGIAACKRNFNVDSYINED